MNDPLRFLAVMIGGFLVGFSVALSIWHPVELEMIDDEMTDVMICRMTTGRSGIIVARCADLQTVVNAARRDSDGSL